MAAHPAEARAAAAFPMATSGVRAPSARSIGTALVLAAAAALPAHAVELNTFGVPDTWQAGPTFTFAGSLRDTGDGARTLEVTADPATWSAFVDRVRPQHDTLAAWGFIPLYAQDTWLVELDGDRVTLTSPLNVVASPYYSDLVARVVLGGFDPKTPVLGVPHVPAVPEPSMWLLLLGGLGFLGWKRARA